MWGEALFTLGALGKDIQHHVGPEFRAAEAEWRAGAIDLVRAYRNNPHIIAKESPDEEELALWRLMCLGSLIPVLSFSDDPEVLPS